MNSIIPPRWHLREETRKAIWREVRMRHAEELERASFGARLLLWLKMEREVAREMRRKYPPRALYQRVGR